MRRVLLVAVVWTVALSGCASMLKRAPGPIKDLPVLINDPDWINGDCQSELHRKGTLGVCAVVTLAKGNRPSNPLEVSKAAIEQGKPQLVDTIKEALVRMIDNCVSQCGNIPQGDPRLQLIGRLTQSMVDALTVSDTWLAGDDNLYALIALDVGTMVSIINRDPDLDAEAKQALAGRARDALRR